ncbi:hypothetical protein AAFC00_006821 [Neodothiora populina]|uniref:Protein arginine N-methyltransferase n=1 Tax=Neodothiora populina TaxID=2781224 RepID=A0ABR3PB95_9PEZI
METLPGVPPEETPIYFYVGQHETKRNVQVTNLLVSQAQDVGYDMITRPITSSSFQNKVLAALDSYFEALSSAAKEEDVPYPLISPLTPEDTNLLPDEYISSMLAVTSPWIDLASPDPVIAHVSRQVFNLEVAYAAFCGVNNMVIEGPRLQGNVAIPVYARSIVQALNVGPYLNLQIRLPMTAKSSKDETQNPRHMASRMRSRYAEAADIASTSSDSLRSWDAWELIRTVCKFHGRLSVALSIPQKLPSMEIQSRWFSEPLRLIELHESTFMRNAKGFPVLSKAIQALITRYTRLKTSPWILLSDVGAIPTDDELDAANPAEDELPTPAQASSANRMPKRPKQKDLTPHLSYIRHLQRSQPPRPIIDRFASGYQDFLQSPLQPLTDNLESITYEVFEKDPVKYEWYERATAAALVDLKKTLNRDIVVAVVGAGRGPLMTRALKASASTGISILPYAVEKNPNAYVLLQNRNATDPLWGKRVQVVKTDMRAWAGPTLPSGEVGKVDILISELLGSFADNELSPECLDGVQHVLHPDHGVSIPTSYTAHFTPIASPKIYSDLLSRTGAGAEDRWELPYVSMLHQFDNLCLASAAKDSTTPSSKDDKAATEPLQPDVQQAWEFTHPIPQAILAQSQLRRGGSAAAGFGGAVGGDGWNEHNARFSKSTFTCTNRGVCHGLGGYFETVLYESKAQGGKKIELSTNPVTMDQKSKDMISWFPIFFPLKTPMYFPDKAEVEVSMWRQTDDRKVWYEWIVEVYARVGAGAETTRQRVAVSDLHSSWKNGCLM